MSLGHTSFVPDKEEYNLTRSQLLARMDVAMGGRVAEELIYGNEKVRRRYFCLCSHYILNIASN